MKERLREQCSLGVAALSQKVVKATQQNGRNNLSSSLDRVKDLVTVLFLVVKVPCRWACHRDGKRFRRKCGWVREEGAQSESLSGSLNRSEPG